MSTLSQLISQVQSLLGDNESIFPASTCTAAIRQALAEFNRQAPQSLVTTLSAVTNQHTYNLTAVDPHAKKILDVLQAESDTAFDLATPLTYTDYIENEHILFRLQDPLPSTETILVRYTANHTIQDLDGATASTLPAHFDQVIVDGSAYWAIHIRLIARIEQVNMSTDLTEKYAAAMQAFKTAFDLGLSEATRRNSPFGEPDPRAWNDPYHTWGQ